VRDRAARLRIGLRSVAIAGMAGSDGRGSLLIRHPGVSTTEVAEAITRRWPDAILLESASASPLWEMCVADAAALARAKRGVEPLRIVILPQRDCERESADRRHVGAEPMPIVF